MNQTSLQKSLTIHETHLNSLYLPQLNDSQDHQTLNPTLNQTLNTARSLQTNMSRLQTLIKEIDREYEICVELEKEVRFYQESYWKFKEEMLGVLGDGRGRVDRVGRVERDTERVLREAEQFLRVYQDG